MQQAFDRQVAQLHSIEDAHQRLLRLVELQLPTPGALQREWSIWLQAWNETALRPEPRVLHTGSYARYHETVARTIAEGQAQGVFTDADPEPRRSFLRLPAHRPGGSSPGLRTGLDGSAIRPPMGHDGHSSRTPLPRAGRLGRC
ncbi:TetR family transcriptional regulator C-terminal domain-containing protein [Streptomyces sp. NPDC059455]|uniref:TetR family transcriptional regulator C-terminal domain-containing protein n=1 Tax=Streptomyces sp. NPDC059455 TaxID=3346837 RepID=UPI0036A61F70